jgi:H+/Cl- antiporter ClcA
MRQPNTPGSSRAKIRGWAQIFVIGLAVGSFGFAMEGCASKLRALIDHLADEKSSAPTLTLTTLGSLVAAIAAVLVAFAAPHAAGSGIPELKVLLNGVRLPPQTMSGRTLLIKILATILVSTACLPLGREGKL